MSSEKKSDRIMRWSLMGVFLGCVLGAVVGIVMGGIKGHPGMESPVGGAAVGAMKGLTTGLVFGLPIGAILGVVAALLLPTKKIMQEDGDEPVTTIYGEPRQSTPSEESVDLEEGSETSETTRNKGK